MQLRGWVNRAVQVAAVGVGAYILYWDWRSLAERSGFPFWAYIEGPLVAIFLARIILGWVRVLPEVVVEVGEPKKSPDAKYTKR